MHRLLILALLFTACDSAMPTALDPLPDVKAAATAASTSSSAQEPDTRTGCQVLQVAARRIITVAPGEAVLRVFLDYEGDGDPYVKVWDGPRHGVLVGQFSPGDIVLELAPGVHQLTVDTEVVEGGALFTCNGSVRAEVPALIEQPESCSAATPVDGRNAFQAISGQELTVFAMTAPATSSLSASVQYTLPNAPLGYDGYLSFVRLRIYSNDALVKEVSGPGLQGFVTNQAIAAQVSSGCVKVTAYQLAVAVDSDPAKPPNYPPISLPDAGVFVILATGFIR